MSETPGRNGRPFESGGRELRMRAAASLGRAWAPAYGLASKHRRIATTLVYGVLAAMAYSGAYVLRFDFSVPAAYRTTLLASLPAVVALRLAASYLLRISAGRWRYVGTRDVFRLVAASSTGTLALYLLTWGSGVLAPVPRSVLVIDLFLYTVLTAGVWLLYRTAFEQLRAMRVAPGEQARILIVGAGEAGSMLAREVARSRLRLNAIGFVDDDPAKRNAMVHGLPVLGGVKELPAIVQRHRIQEIVIAVPSATPQQLRSIVAQCEETDLTFKVLPGLIDVFEGRVDWGQVRPLRVEDLLGRDPIALELPELMGDLSGRAVLITGAAGSIGSELTRQVALHRPRVLVLLDQSETGLFELARELPDPGDEVEVHCVVADIADEVAVEDVFRRFGPSRVFHAAAYKHVTMMQHNVRQAIRNNVFGTIVVAAAAGRHRSEKFVFVSTDKAVCPTSIMGATKRLAEMAVMELQGRYSQTAYAAVRFGNVLGSNGSVIPIFRRQIERGEPLTVTDPAATRYFMMIPEAVQLILQASLLPQVQGRIAMLDMGEPVRIIDLARSLLRIAGLPYRNGNSIVFTGLRQGEKLHEQLVAPSEMTVPTPIEKVRIIVSEPLPQVSFESLLCDWESEFRAGRPDRVIAALRSLFPDLQVGDVPAAHPEQHGPASPDAVRVRSRAGLSALASASATEEDRI